MASLQVESQQRVVQSFLNRPATLEQDASADVPAYSVAFPHTDFVEPLAASFVSDIACSLHALIATHATDGVFSSCDLLVGEADRLLGAIIHEVSIRTALPYSLINWYPEGSCGEVAVQGAKGFSGKGVSYLNGVRAGMNVILLGDTLDAVTLDTVVKAVTDAGATVQHAAFLVEMIPNQQRGKITSATDAAHLSVLAALDVDATTKRTILHAPPATLVPVSANAKDHARRVLIDVQNLPSATSESVLDTLTSISQAFIGIPIHRNPTLQYPYSFFQLTDFVPVMQPDVVESMCDMSMVLAKCLRPGALDLLVSECDRGGGPLVQGIAHRMAPWNIPYVMAMWRTNVQHSTTVQAQVGFSGVGNLVINGIVKKPNGDAPRVVFVDDMLSSGGTAEGVLRAVEAAGGVPVEAVFVSEKLYLDEPNPRKGYERLKKSWPALIITTLVQFVATGDTTTKGCA